MKGEFALEIEKLNYSYDVSGHRGVKSISLKLKRGELLGVLGPNGSGKSTLLRLIAGVLDSPQALIKIDGLDVNTMSRHSRARLAAYAGPMLESPFPMTGLESVSMGLLPAEVLGQLSRVGDNSGQLAEKLEQMMRQCQCWELRDRSIQTLSTGQRQLLLLARVFVQSTSLILLDETLEHLDLNYQHRMLDFIRLLAATNGFSFIVVSHHLLYISKWFDKIALINEGQVVAFGKPAEVLTKGNISVLYPGISIENIFLTDPKGP